MADHTLAALQHLLTEMLHGPAGDGWSFVLNPGDPGILPTLEALSAQTASRPPVYGRATIAAHANHLRFSLELLNRWAAGDADVFAAADWQRSWRVTSVDEGAWRQLLADLRREAEAWIAAPKDPAGWDRVAFTGAFAAPAHLAYHLGSIRQLVAHQQAAA